MKITEKPGISSLCLLPLQRPVGTLMIGLALVLGGIWSLITIDRDFLPDFTVPKLSILAPYQGLPAGEIRELITLPLEEALSSLNGLKRLESLSRDGLSLLELTFPWGTDRALAGLRTREIIDTAYLSLPSESDKPQVLPVDPGDLPILVLGVHPKSGDLSLARRLSDREIRMRLQQIDGVGSIQIRGGLEEEIHIEADPSLLTGRGLSLPELSNELSGMNMDYPAGSITEGSIEYLIKVKSRAESIEQLEELYIPGRFCRLKDVASVSFGSGEQRSFFVHWNKSDSPDMKEGVMMLLRRQGGFSPKLMAENVKAELDNLQKSYGRDLDIFLILDRSAVLDRSFRDLAVSLLLGAVIAFIVLLVFLQSRRQACIVLLSIPSSLLWAVLFLNLSGQSLNLMSLGGLALGVGMVVDNAIVVIERLARSIRKGEGRNKRLEGIATEITRLAPSLIGSTTTTLVVFIPLLFLSGINGSLFRDLALGVIFALSSSLLIAMSVIPVLYLLVNPPGEKRKNTGRLYTMLRSFQRKSLRRPGPVFLILCVIGLSGIFILTRLPLEILPPLNEGRLNFRIFMSPGTRLEAMKILAGEVVEDLSALDYVQDIQVWAGGETNDPYYLSSVDEGIDILQGSICYPTRRTVDTVRSDVMAVLQPFAGTLNILPPENILENLLGIDRGGEWAVPGDDPDRAREKALRLLPLLAEASDTIEIPAIIPPEPKMLIRLYPDRQALAALGVELPLLIRQIGQALYGSVPTRILIEGREVDVRLRSREQDRQTRNDIMELELPITDTSRIRLASVARLEQEKATPYLYRSNRQDIAVIRFPDQPTDGQLAVLRTAGARAVDSSSLKDQAGEILMLFAAALLLLYVALGVQFESFLLPLLLMISIPLGMSGISIALIINNGSINLNSSLGSLMLMGLSVNNGILFYEEYTHRRNMVGATGVGALYRGISDRLRPILMTSLTTLGALLPLAVDPKGTSSQAALATAVIGGLTASTILSLILLPHIILAAEKRK